MLYCEAWANSLEPDSGQITDGREVRRIFEDYCCTSFTAHGTFNLNRWGEIRDSYIDEYAEHDCDDHYEAAVRQIDIDDTDDMVQALSNQGFYICEECESSTVWNDADDWGDHRLEEHEDNEDDDEEPVAHPAFLNVHTNWPQPTAP